MNTSRAVRAIAPVLLAYITTGHAASMDHARIEQLTRSIEPQVIAWRRDIHEHPELSNREVRTAKLVAEHLKRLGLEVQTGVAHTGVVGLLKGGRPGPTVALRADMDALPVTEKTDVPFRSRATGTYRGKTVGVMHACGHDVHTAVLMGVASTLVELKESLAGNVLFVFQPAEEGAPDGEEGGASLMLKEGVFDKYSPRAAFGLHVTSNLRVGEIGVRSGPFYAASNRWRIEVIGKQAHGSRPWQGVDPILTAAQIITGLQGIVSRQVDLTENPAVISVGIIESGVRNNIIPDRAEMIGTLRTFDDAQRDDIVARMKRIVENTAEANGATATFTLQPDGYPVTYNDPELTERMIPTLQRVAGEEHVKRVNLVTGAEDFSFFARKVPSMYFQVGITPADQDPASAPSNHSDFFYVDERGIPVALRAMAQVAVDYLQQSLNR